MSALPSAPSAPFRFSPRARRSASSRRKPRRCRLLVCEGRFRHQIAQGRQRPHDRVFVARLVDRVGGARLHRREQAECETDADRQPARHPDCGDDRSGRYRLGRASVRSQGDGRRQDRHGRKGDGCRDRARADDPRPSSPTRRRWKRRGRSWSASCRPIAKPSTICTTATRR